MNVLITVADLRSQSVKDLAAMARKLGLTGIHAMRKEQLVKALLKAAKSQQRAAVNSSRGGVSKGLRIAIRLLFGLVRQFGAQSVPSPGTRGGHSQREPAGGSPVAARPVSDRVQRKIQQIERSTSEPAGLVVCLRNGVQQRWQWGSWSVQSEERGGQGPHRVVGAQTPIGCRLAGMLPGTVSCERKRHWRNTGTRQSRFCV